MKLHLSVYQINCIILYENEINLENESIYVNWVIKEINWLDK